MTDLRPHPTPKRLRYYARDYAAYHIENYKRMPGKMPDGQVQVVAGLVKPFLESGLVPRLLDYGSGKGYQYLRHRVHEVWGGALPICYDPGVLHLSDRPSGLFDGILCLDVLEHIEVEDLDATLTDIFLYTKPATHPDRFTSFIYFHICCRLAHKHFPDGRNLHRTVQLPDWWGAVIAPFARRAPHVKVVATYELPQADDGSQADASDPGNTHT